MDPIRVCCPSCQKPYDNDRFPRFRITCGHSICDPCCQKQQDHSCIVCNKKSCNCGLCTKVNIPLQKLLEQLELSQNANSFTQIAIEALNLRIEKVKDECKKLEAIYNIKIPDDDGEQFIATPTTPKANYKMLLSCPYIEETIDFLNCVFITDTYCGSKGKIRTLKNIIKFPIHCFTYMSHLFYSGSFNLTNKLYSNLPVQKNWQFEEALAIWTSLPAKNQKLTKKREKLRFELEQEKKKLVIMTSEFKAKYDKC